MRGGLIELSAYAAFSASAAFVTILLALVVFLVAPGRSWNRSLGLFLVLFGTVRFAEAMRAALWTNDPAGWAYWTGVAGYFWLVDDLALFYFVSVFPRRLGWLPRRMPYMPFVGAAGVLVALYAFNHEWLHAGADAPLILVDFVLTSIAYGLVPLWLVGRSMWGGSDRAPSLLLTAGSLAAWYMAWLVGNAVLVAATGEVVVSGAQEVGPAAPSNVAWFYVINIAVFLTLQAALLGLLVLRSLRAPSGEKAVTHGVLVLLLIAAASGLVWGVLRAAAAEAALALGAFVTVWFAVGAILLAYGILRHQLFDIDLKIKWTIKRSTLVALFVAFFFVVSELAAVFFADRIGTVLGILAAGVLLFAIAPLQRLADRVSDAAMPRVKDTQEYRTVRKREVYRAALESAIEDGDITDKERSMLATLADQLQLTSAEALRLERQVAAGQAMS